MTSRAPWIEVLAAAAIGVVELAAAIGLHVWFEKQADDLRPIPPLAAVPWVLVGLAAFAWVFGFWRVIVRRRELVTTKLKVATFVLLGGHSLVTFAGAVGVLVSDPDFLFGQTLDDTIDLPDGGHAYLYRGGLFCSYEVFVATADDYLAARVRYVSRNDCEVPGRLRLEGDQLKIVDETGRPLEDNADWGAFFDWRPH